MGFSHDKGFEIVVDIRHHILRCRLWGNWDLDLVRNYKYALMDKITEVRRDAEGWCALADVKAFYPLSEEVQRLIRDYLDVAKARGMKQIVYVGVKPAFRRRLDRFFAEYGTECSVFAESEEQALQWLLEGMCC